MNRADFLREQLSRARKRQTELVGELGFQEKVIRDLEKQLEDEGESLELGIKPGRPLHENIARVMRREGRAMGAGELAEVLGNEGVESDAKAGLKQVIAATLANRSDLFRRVSRGVYEIKK